MKIKTTKQLIPHVTIKDIASGEVFKYRDGIAYYMRIVDVPNNGWTKSLAASLKDGKVFEISASAPLQRVNSELTIEEVR